MERAFDVGPVRVVDDHERTRAQPWLGDAQAFELRTVVVSGVVVPDADRNAGEGSAGHELERVADEELRSRQPEALDASSTCSRVRP